MRTFLIRVLFLFIIVFAFDRGLGLVFGYVANHIKIGSQGKDNYICKEANEDILIFGSSRAVHHYNAKMIEDSLKLTCYNCGEEGNGIILDYARLLMNLERHKPQIIICDIYSSFDLELNDNHKYLGWLKTHYNKKGIKDIFDDVDRTEKYKMLSLLYRYNSKYLQNIVVFLSNRANSIDTKGYVPKKGKMNLLPKREENKLDNFNIVYDSLKINYIKKFIDKCKGIQLYFIASPNYHDNRNEIYNPIVTICEQKGIPFLDFTNDTLFVDNKEYFIDGIHLNSDGADVFTSKVINCLKKEL